MPILGYFIHLLHSAYLEQMPPVCISSCGKENQSVNVLCQQRTPRFVNNKSSF